MGSAGQLMRSTPERGICGGTGGGISPWPGESALGWEERQTLWGLLATGARAGLGVCLCEPVVGEEKFLRPAAVVLGGVGDDEGGLTGVALGKIRRWLRRHGGMGGCDLWICR